MVSEVLSYNIQEWICLKKRKYVWSCIKNVFPDNVLPFFNWNVWIISSTREANMLSISSPSASLPQPREKLFWELGALSSCFPFATPNVPLLPPSCLQQSRGRKEKVLLGTLLHGNQMGCVWAYSRTPKIMIHLFQTVAPDHPEPTVAIAQDSGGAQTCVSWLLAARDYVLSRWG